MDIEGAFGEFAYCVFTAKYPSEVMMILDLPDRGWDDEINGKKIQVRATRRNGSCRLFLSEKVLEICDYAVLIRIDEDWGAAEGMGYISIPAFKKLGVIDPRFSVYTPNRSVGCDCLTDLRWLTRECAYGARWVERRMRLASCVKHGVAVLPKHTNGAKVVPGVR